MLSDGRDGPRQRTQHPPFALHMALPCDEVHDSARYSTQEKAASRRRYLLGCDVHPALCIVLFREIPNGTFG